MSLRVKIILIGVTSFVVVAGVIFLATHLLLYSKINNLEANAADRQMEQVRNVFDNQLDGMENTCLDWASWDDSYAFMADHNQDYLTSNLPDSTYDTLKLNLVVYADTQGGVVYGQGYDLNQAETTTLPADLTTALRGQGVTFFTAEGGDDIRGIIMFEGQPMLVAACPILTSQDEGPARGTLLFGRYLTPGVISSLGNLVSTPLTMYLSTDASVPPLIRDARAAFDGGATVYGEALDAKSYGGVINFTNLDGQRIVIIQADFARSLFGPIRSFGVYLMLGLLLFSTLATGVSLYLGDRWFLRRLSGLSRDVQRVGLMGNINERVKVYGTDEISVVAKSVNTTLDVLQQTRDALAASAEQYRDLFDNASDMIQSVDQSGRFVYTNPAWHDTLGYDRDEVASLVLRDVIHPDHAAEHLKLFSRALAGETIESAEVDFITRDGNKVNVIGSIGCRVVEGEPAYTRGIFHDISEIRAAREAQREAYETEKGLRHSLQDAITKRIEFSRMVAHELKNSLTVLMVSSEMLEDNPKPEQVTVLSQNIRRSADHLQSRINEMLDMARIEMGTLSISTEPTNPVPVLREMADYLRPIAEKRGQTVRLEEPGKLPDIEADKDRLCQIFINLLENASRYTPADGTITLGGAAAPPFVRFFVKDTGRGIDARETERVFEAYYRPERDRDRISGLGLGLALCKMLVEKHGGTIEVASEVGRGTTFSFTIPLAGNGATNGADVV